MNCEQTAKPLHPLDRSMCISSPFRNTSMKKAPKNHRSQVPFFMPPTGVEPGPELFRRKTGTRIQRTSVKFRNPLLREGNRKHGARNRNVLQNVLFLKTFRIKNPAENVVQVCGSLHILAMNKMRVDPERVHLAGVANQGLDLSLWQRFCQ